MCECALLRNSYSHDCHVLQSGNSQQTDAEIALVLDVLLVQASDRGTSYGVAHDIERRHSALGYFQQSNPEL